VKLELLLSSEKGQSDELEVRERAIRHLSVEEGDAGKAG
jgi:hypothetical protein